MRLGLTAKMVNRGERLIDRRNRFDLDDLTAGLEYKAKGFGYARCGNFRVLESCS